MKERKEGRKKRRSLPTLLDSDLGKRKGAGKNISLDP
jgi:hypothetical protein